MPAPKGIPKNRPGFHFRKVDKAFADKHQWGINISIPVLGGLLWVIWIAAGATGWAFPAVAAVSLIISVVLFRQYIIPRNQKLLKELESFEKDPLKYTKKDVDLTKSTLCRRIIKLMKIKDPKETEKEELENLKLELKKNINKVKDGTKGPFSSFKKAAITILYAFVPFLSLAVYLYITYIKPYLIDTTNDFFPSDDSKPLLKSGKKIKQKAKEVESKEDLSKDIEEDKEYIQNKNGIEKHVGEMDEELENVVDKKHVVKNEQNMGFKKELKKGQTGSQGLNISRSSSSSLLSSSSSDINLDNISDNKQKEMGLLFKGVDGVKNDKVNRKPLVQNGLPTVPL